MRLASIILPNDDNHGQPLAHAHRALRESILDHFGGYTSGAVNGAWRDPVSGKLYVEPGIRYDIACEATESVARELRSIARDVCAMARQACVFLTLPTGDVEFVEPAPMALAAE